MNESEFQEFLFDSDVALALMRGLSYEEAVEEAKEIRRDEREWQRLTKYAPDVASVTSAEPDSGLESVPAVESGTQPRG